MKEKDWERMKIEERKQRKQMKEKDRERMKVEEKKTEKVDEGERQGKNEG